MTVPNDPVTMLLRLSRAAFWLAAIAVGLGLVAPGSYATPLLGLVTLAVALAFLTWRAALRAPLHAADAPAEAPVTPDAGALRDIEADLMRRIDTAPTFEAALHAGAQLLRNEFGAREAAVYLVAACDGRVEQLHRLVAAQPGFRGVARRVHLDGTVLARAITQRLPAGAPPSTVALPVCRGERVVAMLEIGGFELAIDPATLAPLLAGAGSRLAQRAVDVAGAPQAAPKVTHIADNPPAPAIAPQPSAQEDREPHRDPRHYDPLPIANPQHPSRIMLRPPVRLHAEAGDPPAGSAVPAAADVLDASALQRLAELDPGGTNRLLERVLSAFQTSVARLRPQADAARRAGDRVGLRLVAHTLKSSSASIGALQLSQLCARIEATVRANDGADLEPDLEALDGALDATLAAIAKRLESRG